MGIKKINQGPLKCWDIYAMHLSNQATQFNKEIELETLRILSNKNNWIFDFEEIILNTYYDAVILTDAEKTIEWVNKGFTKMTGYAANYAIGKKPVFLQGNKTSTKSLQNISNHLKSGMSIKETILNYRNTGGIYNCHIEIFPLKNSHGLITHYIAFEKETRM